jgi:hydroxyacyl-ACP dehydratase HTD2-like protein with hotdog domain
MTDATGAQRHIGDVAVGEELAVVVKRASRAQLFLYSGATWNAHRIHYDRDYAATEGYPDVLVHGPLQGAWITQYFTDWAGPRGRLVSVSWQNRRSAFPDTDYELRGRVLSVDTSTGVVEIEACEQTVDGERLVPVRAAVRLPVDRSGG